MYTKAQEAYIKKANEAARTFYMILRQFERGRISAAEMDKAIFQTVSRHKYSREYLHAATEAIRATSARSYSENITEDIRRAAEA